MKEEEEMLYAGANLEKPVADLATSHGALEKELELTRQVLWAAVKAAGGRISIPYSIWAGPLRGVELEFVEDPSKMMIVVRALDKKHGEVQQS